MLKKSTFMSVVFLVFLIACNNGGSDKATETVCDVQAVIDYLNGFATDSLTKENIKACTPNQVIQIYCRSLIMGDNVTYQNLHLHPVKKLDNYYGITDFTTSLDSESGEGIKTFRIAFDLESNSGELFPKDSKRISLLCRLVFKSSCWQIENIEYLNKEAEKVN
ncbi:MAG: hypothetical protein PHI24_13130 [Desulfitobacteriaceae bacterium]|nr:hypothetical protein [Eubacteriales bacterium]MDD4402760.1 hypothetical protein [Desulfitobacteriaceae bacterium]